MLECIISVRGSTFFRQRDKSFDSHAFLSRIDSAFSDLIDGEGFSPEMFQRSGFPRIRPILVMLSARAVQKDEQRFEESELEHIALATELLHAAIFVHDLALGRQGGRRRRVARKLFGGAFGWIGGNQLTLRALELSRHAPAPELVGDVLDTLREIADGHALSQSIENRVATPEEKIWEGTTESTPEICSLSALLSPWLLSRRAKK